MNKVLLFKSSTDENNEPYQITLYNVEMKFSSTAQDPVNGSDFIHRAFGGNTGKSIRRRRHFKCFLKENV